MQKLVRICRCDRCSCEIPPEAVNVVTLNSYSYDLCNVCSERVRMLLDRATDNIIRGFDHHEGRPANE